MPFDVIPHPSADYRWGFYTPFYTFSRAHRRVIRDTFILTFLGFSFLPGVLRFWVSVFYPWAFLPYTPSFVTQARAGTPHPGSSSVPALTELFLSADAWTWTIDVWITRPLIYQLCQWATKYRVKIEVLNVSLVQSQQNNYFWLAQSQPNNYFFVTCSKSAKWLIQNQTFILPLIQHQILTLLLNLNQILVPCLWV